MTRYKFTIEYKGTDYAGWQRQENVPSIQQAIEEAITAFSGQEARLHVAGRTDAGVHARGQVAHVDLEEFSKSMDAFEVGKAINHYLRPQPIAIVESEEVDEEFHARFHAINKLYHYRIINRAAFLTLDEGFAWQIRRDLDVPAMQEAAKILIGHHDFSSFRDSECQAKSPEKTLDRLDITQQDDEILFATEGKSFLHHQVRNMVGTLVLVGEGKWSKNDIKAALEARDRTKAGPTARAEGLYLMRVDY